MITLRTLMMCAIVLCIAFQFKYLYRKKGNKTENAKDKVFCYSREIDSVGCVVSDISETSSRMDSEILTQGTQSHRQSFSLEFWKLSFKKAFIRCGEKGTLLNCWWECKLIQPLWRFLKKLKVELPYDPAIPLLGIYPEKTIIQKESCTTMFIATLFTIARTWKQPKCPSTDEWIKMWHIYTMEYY